MRRLVQRSHFRIFLLTLLVVFFAVPLIPQPERGGAGFGGFFVQLIFAQALLGAVYAVSDHRLLRKLIYATIVPPVVLSGLAAFGVLSFLPWAIVSSGLNLVGFSLIAFAISAHLMRETRVTIDTIASALAIYLLFGLIWALAYHLFEVFDPDAFGGLQPALETGLGEAGLRTDFKALLYFSFVTLTTLGYGDIVPLHPFVRSMAVLQAALGQIYIAILVARLVGIHTVRTMAAADVEASGPAADPTGDSTGD